MLMQRCIQIHFTSYNETQARQILAKNFQQRLEHIDRLQDDTNDEEKDVGLEADKKLIKHEMSEQFASVIEHSLPQIYVFSHNLRDIFCIMLSIWHVWYKESACHMYESLIDKRKNSFVQTLRSTRTSPASSRLVSPVSSTSLQKPPITMIRGILELLLQRNILNVSVQDLTSIRKSLNLDETNAATAKGDQRKKVAAKDSFTVNTNMIPHRLKYLIVACFLASHNPKGSDNLTFIGEKSKKRKAQESTGANAKESLEASMTNTQGASQSNKAQSSNRYFSLERLLSIYAQVLRLSVQEAEDACYGSASLQALIMTLVNRKLMSLSPHWKASKPLYGSNISRSLADEIARSIHFPLNDFLVQHYKLAI